MGATITSHALEIPLRALAVVRSGALLHSLEVELRTQPLAAARDLGLNEAWATRIQKANPSAREVLGVARLVAGSDAARQLQTGDLLLAIDGQVVTRFRDVERAVAAHDAVQVTVWRGDSEHSFTVHTAALSGQDIDRVLLWAGATLQAPHRALAVQRGVEPTGVYISFFAFGSPAARFGLAPGRRIVEVDGQATPDLDAFLKQVSGRADRSSLRIKTLAWNGAVDMITLKLDRHYFPTYELQRVGDDWERRQLE